MLLSLMRKNAQSWLIKAVMVVIAVVFVLYFGTMREDKRNTQAAVVNGEVITHQEYDKAYTEIMDAYRDQYKDLWSEELAKSLDIKNMVLENLINQALIGQEAKRLGLDVTKEEIQNAIMNLGAFKTNNRFDMQRYSAILRQRHMQPENFEETVGKELLNNKLRQFLSTFSVVTDQEVLDQYKYAHEEIKVSYVRFEPDKFRKAVEPDETAIKNFFDQHNEQYRIPEKVKIAYIEFDPKAFEAGVEISEQEIRDYYEENIDSYAEPKEVRARHILFKLEKNASEAEVDAVKAKALGVLKQAREGRDFAELAKKYSEDPTSKSKGGDLGYFSKGQMIKPFEDAAFKLKAGEISDLVRTDFGYHIIQVEDVKEPSTKTFEQVHDSIKETLANTAAATLAYEKGQTLIDQMPYGTDLTKYAAEKNLKVIYTDYLPQNGRIPGIGVEKMQMQTIFSLAKNESSELMDIRGKYYVFQVADRQESFVPGMEAVKAQVKEDLANYLAAEKAKEVAGSFLAKLKNGNAWDDLAKKEGVKIEQSDFFNRQGPIPNMDYDPDLMLALFKLDENKRYPDRVFENKGGSFVFRWEAYKGVDEEAYQKEKEKQRYTMMREEQTRIFEDWLQSLRKKAKIEKFSNL